MDITKVKVSSSGDVAIEYEQESKSGAPERRKLEVADEPLPAFFEALDELLPEVINVGRLDAESWSEANVTGVSIKHTDAGLGMVATAQLKAAEIGTPLIFNTPYLKPEDQGLNATVALERICKEAERYVKGDRKSSQLSLLVKEEVAA